MIDDVSAYYQSNLDNLTFKNRFHFASRLWLWNQNPNMEALLKNYREEFCANGDKKKFNNILAELAHNSNGEIGTKSAAILRRKYFNKYPNLRPALLLLFRLLFTETIYGIDARRELTNHISEHELKKLNKNLGEDLLGAATLSTHAANFLYLFHRFYKQDDNTNIQDYLYSLGKQYDLSDKTQLMLYVYLHTHCIIGETLFYKRRIEINKNSIYTKMINDLNQCLMNNYDSLNLDNKFEILVCNRIMGSFCPSTDKVYEEAMNSVSNTGYFIVDRHNNNSANGSSDLNSSEHRNVLCIMSASEYSPTTKTIN